MHATFSPCRIADFSLTEFILADVKVWAGMAQILTVYFVSAFVGHLILFGIQVFVLVYLIQQYNTGTGMFSRSSATSNSSRVLNRQSLFLLAVLVYLFALPTLRPEKPYARLSVPPALDALYFGIQMYLHTAAPALNWDWKETLIPSSPQFSLPPSEKQSESTDKALNVVLFVMETTRSDMGPFNYSSPFAEQHLNKERVHY